MKHIRGILLFGPPGTGKTTIARQLGKALNSHPPIIKSGPDFLNKYVGESERQIREVFEPAEQEQKKSGENSELHIIIIDEIDAICRKRSSGGEGNQTGDSIVNQLLSKIDGVDSLDNILMIGMTNRLDIIDPALIRPGRLELNVEIGLADEKGRFDILSIHASPMVKSGRMAGDVDLEDVAAKTRNYSGAELESIVSAATQNAFGELVDFTNLTKMPSDTELAKLTVTKANFDKALAETKPQLGRNDADLGQSLVFPFVEYSDTFKHMLRQCRLVVDQVRSHSKAGLSHSSLLLSGRSQVGTSALAAKLVLDANFPFVRVLSAETLLGQGARKQAAVQEVFRDAWKCELACIVLEDVERIMEFVAVGQRFNMPILQDVRTLLRKKPPPGKRLMIVGTTSCPEFVKDFEIETDFIHHVDVPELSSKADKEVILRSLPGFREDPTAVSRCIEHLGDEMVGVKRLCLDANAALFKSETEGIAIDVAFAEDLLRRRCKM